MKKYQMPMSQWMEIQTSPICGGSPVKSDDNPLEDVPMPTPQAPRKL